MGLLLASQNIAFTVALVVLLGLAVLQAVSMASGGAVDHAIDHLIGDVDADVLGWLHVGRAPFLVLLILFLSGFAVTGYAAQMLARGVVGGFLPGPLAAIPAVAAGVGAVRVLGGAFARVMPGIESEAVSEASFVGRAAVVVAGVAERGNPAQARLQDQHGQSHYVMVEPDLEGERFTAGASVLLVRRNGGRFAAIANPHPDLL